MKNIISWTAPERTFSDKLLERIRLVLRPLERANRQNLELEAERSEFNRLPIYERLGVLQKTCIKQLHAHSFQSIPMPLDISNGTAPTLWKCLRRFDDTRYQGIGIITTSSPSKQLLQYLSWHSLYDVLSPNRPNAVLRESHYIVASLNSVPRSRIMEALPNMHVRNNITLTSERKTSLGAQSIIYVHIIDGIKSVSEFLAAFRAIMDENSLTKGG